MAPAVVIDHVTKLFGSQVAVNQLSLTVPANTIYGFIGPNGSGKTTTLRMIMRIIHPNSGTLSVLGSQTLGSADHRVAYLPEERGLYKKMKVRETLNFHAVLKGKRPTRAELDHWLERMGMQDWGDKPIETLSKGMAQKVQFVATVIAEPHLVLLDEPFSGLDPVNAEVLRDAVLELHRRGTTIIFSTHDMSVAERMCDFIFMIYKGNKVLDGTLDDIQDAYGNDTLRVRLDNNSDDLGTLPGVTKVTNHGKLQELRLERGTDTQAILDLLRQRGIVRHFELTRPSLQDIFVRIAAPNPEEMHLA